MGLSGSKANSHDSQETKGCDRYVSELNHLMPRRLKVTKTSFSYD